MYHLSYNVGIAVRADATCEIFQWTAGKARNVEIVDYHS